MSRVYDNWEKLVEAVVRREKDRQLAYCDSLSSTSSSDFTFHIHLPPEVSSQTFDLSNHGIFVFRNVKVIEYDRIGMFGQDMLLWKEGSGHVGQGWVDHQFLTTTKPPSETVKKMNNRRKQEHKDWLVEISYLGQADDLNYIKLIGYSFHITNNFLKYEFMPKGSLDTYMLTRWHENPPWATRMKVALGAARALTLLQHLEMPTTEDDEFTATLWDFGLAVKGPFGVINQVGATEGPYAAPEYISTGQLSAECDVYSFGVVLIEVMTGLRALERRWPAKYMMDWVKPYLGDEKNEWMIMDGRLNGQYPRKEAHEVGRIASQCISSDPTSRPTMAEVVAALQQLVMNPTNGVSQPKFI